ncbi:hypothetical protein HY629_02250 [Candidatus Uhrbacteria bacterium]|nr:hypothetical protein [Candidatus Uhrbacteria bacterium]
MSSFSDLTKLLEQHPNHRLVIIREDGTPVGVLLGVAEYSALISAREPSTPQPKKHAPRTQPKEELREAPIGEWDALVEQVSGEKIAGDADGDTYLFEPDE